MSAFNRIIRIHASRRTYSYFSSRSGGGRYFNSNKPPKAPVVAGQNAGVKGESSVENKQASISCSSSSEPTSQNTELESDSSTTTQDSPLPRQHISSLLLTPDELRTHQFFSLHRPLLLISKPSSLFRNIPPNHPLFVPLAPSERDIQTGVMQAISGIGELPSEPSLIVDADAETARQLTRSLTVTKAGATVAWEDTLKRLGLDVSKEAERVGLQEQFDKDWEDVMLDSTKRKRRKKMKKHKLKKRRRLTRSERMRLK